MTSRSTSRGRHASKPFLLLCTCLGVGALACTSDQTTQPSTDAAPRPSATSSAGYTVQDLGTLGGTSSGASDINNAGIVVGASRTASGNTHAFRWQNGVMTDLGTLGGNNSGAHAINGDGAIVGYAENANGRDRAVRWWQGRTRGLGTLGGLRSRALDINSSGWIVGWSLTTSGEQHAFLWRNGVMTDLGTLGGPLSMATGISASGAIVGYSTKTAGTLAREYPFRWKDGVMHELPSLGGAFTRPSAINGWIVGAGEPEGGDGDLIHAVIWDGNVLRDLGQLNNGDRTEALNVNGAGIVVGQIDYNPPDCERVDAFVWDGGTLTLLPHIGGENGVSGARGINLMGQVVGYSETDTGSGDCEIGQLHAALWTRN
jgi:probable HAF family extracellular repeat protein